MTNRIQLELFTKPDHSAEIRHVILRVLRDHRQPSARELIALIESDVAIEARWQLAGVIQGLAEDSDLRATDREYLRWLVKDADLARALRGEESPNRETVSSIDVLLAQSKRYRESEAFREMIEFMARFRDYAPYNNMLVRLQNPSCSFYATEKDWRTRFNRELKEDARPMLILAPMHPVMLVYDLDQTKGDEVPHELREFVHFEGDWDSRCLSRLVDNAAGHGIRVQFKTLSSTHGGLATLARGAGDWKMRVVVHDQLDEPGRCGVLCHELAHILLGHLGSNWDYWWPARTSLSRAAVEVEAEAVAWIVTTRLGLTGPSPAYISRHMKEGQTPVGVSLDMIAKTAGHIERMAKENMPPRKPRARKKNK